MSIDDHIAAIKEHLKAIEAENQPKQSKSKRYLVVELRGFNTARDGRDIIDICHAARAEFVRDSKMQSVLDSKAKMNEFERVLRYGKIITVNEE
ncbi:MAG: hypothetical protein NC418_02460 [Muribaculaceae bacterium]|nr:hypothetical protein [Muribaculaceae bacterium]